MYAPWPVPPAASATVDIGVTTLPLGRNAWRPWQQSDLNGINALEHAIQKHISVVMWYADWAHNQPNVEQLEAIAARGSTPEITWEPWDALNPVRYQPRYRLRNIVAGHFDSYIRAWANTLAAYERPVRLRFAQEMNGGWYPWSERSNGNRPHEFVRAWRHIHDIFRAAGATNVEWVWSPAAITMHASQYPGDAYVDLVSLSCFNGDSQLRYSRWKPFAQVLGRSLRPLAHDRADKADRDQRDRRRRHGREQSRMDWWDVRDLASQPVDCVGDLVRPREGIRLAIRERAAGDCGIRSGRRRPPLPLNCDNNEGPSSECSGGSSSGCHDPTFPSWDMSLVFCVGARGRRPPSSSHLLSSPVPHVSPTRRFIRVLPRARAQSLPLAGAARVVLYGALAATFLLYPAAGQSVPQRPGRAADLRRLPGWRGRHRRAGGKNGTGGPVETTSGAPGAACARTSLRPPHVRELLRRRLAFARRPGRPGHRGVHGGRVPGRARADVPSGRPGSGEGRAGLHGVRSGCGADVRAEPPLRRAPGDERGERTQRPQCRGRRVPWSGGRADPGRDRSKVGGAAQGFLAGRDRLQLGLRFGPGRDGVLAPTRAFWRRSLPQVGRLGRTRRLSRDVGPAHSGQRSQSDDGQDDARVTRCSPPSIHAARRSPLERAHPRLGDRLSDRGLVARRRCRSMSCGLPSQS